MSKSKIVRQEKRRQKEEDQKETIKYYQCIIYALAKQSGGEVVLSADSVMYPDGDLSITYDKDSSVLLVRAQKTTERDIPYPEKDKTKSYSSHKLNRGISLSIGNGERMIGKPGDWFVFSDSGEEFVVSDEEHKKLFPSTNRIS
jgi:hypothetical protein